MTVWRILSLIVSFILTLLLSFVLSKAQQTPIVSWNGFGPGELRVERFQTSQVLSLTISGTGIKPDYRKRDWDNEEDERDFALAYGWILNLETRQPVWSMAREMGGMGWSKKGVSRVDAKVNLPAGQYALYYYCGIGKGQFYSFNFEGDEENGFWEGLRRFFGNADNFYSDKNRKKLFLNVSAEKNLFRPLTEDPLEARIALSITQPRNSSFKSLNFKLAEPTTVTIYCLGESPPSYDQAADGGYIQDMRTRKKVWELIYENSEYAGGAEKNRKFFGKLTLPAGDYQLAYYTDDSHTFGRWNAPPPYDPESWGVSLLTGPGQKKIVPVEPAKEPVVVQFLRVRDNELLSSGFVLDRPMDLRIYCIGEYSERDNSFADYGYIEDAATGQRAWEMTRANTEPAGGADKNRMFDGIVHFSRGKYLVRYVTDDSHSYGDWNSTPPYDQDHWGIVVAGVPGSFDPKAMHPYDEAAVESKNVLVKMVGLRDDEDREQRIRLTKTTALHVYAIGEGDRDDMYDYGSIENNQTGRTVWEMNWRNTIPAGGASKNRLFDDNIILSPGSYTVRFVTDGSHSTSNWNAAPPKDPFNWGITISLAQ